LIPLHFQLNITRQKPVAVFANSRAPNERWEVVMPEKPDLTKMSPEEIKKLEESLTAFISQMKSTGNLPEALARIRMSEAEHSSHLSA
jgi:hypothetical protein